MSFIDGRNINELTTEVKLITLQTDEDEHVLGMPPRAQERLTSEALDEIEKEVHETFEVDDTDELWDKFGEEKELGSITVTSSEVDFNPRDVLL